jgi:hypothetical protein
MAIDAALWASETEEGNCANAPLREVPVMSSYPPPPPYPPQGPPPGSVGRRIEEAVELIEMEMRHTIAFVNDAVVPQVRRESISALRTVADKLRELADRFEQNRGPRG